MSWETGLRERKKAATRCALHEAAWGLALELGPERVTVEAFADAPGVSRRTFSNYFGSKEEDLMYGDLQRFQRMVAIVHGRPADETPWTALSATAEEFLQETGDAGSSGETAVAGAVMAANAGPMACLQGMTMTGQRPRRIRRVATEIPHQRRQPREVPTTTTSARNSSAIAASASVG
jgi:AcrR family transcriptional regulator